MIGVVGVFHHVVLDTPLDKIYQKLLITQMAWLLLQELINLLWRLEISNVCHLLRFNVVVVVVVRVVISIIVIAAPIIIIVVVLLKTFHKYMWTLTKVLNLACLSFHQILEIGKFTGYILMAHAVLFLFISGEYAHVILSYSLTIECGTENSTVCVHVKTKLPLKLFQWL